MNFNAKPKKYGLIQRSLKPTSLVPIRNVLGDDESDEDVQNIDKVNREIIRARQLAAEKALNLTDKVLQENPDLYDYDSYVDQKQIVTEKAVIAAKTAKKEEAKKSKYVQDILAVSKVRELEQDRLYERRLLKERKAEDEEFPDTEKFVTAAYREKLAEAAKWEYEDKLADVIDANTDVRSKGMAGFYSNLLTKNISMGGSMNAAVSAYTAGSERQNLVQGKISSKQTDDNNYSLSSASEAAIHDEYEKKQDIYSHEINNTFSADEVISIAIDSKTTPSEEEERSKDVVTKEVIIQSAKERYEARKRQKTIEATLN